MPLRSAEPVMSVALPLPACHRGGGPGRGILPMNPPGDNRSPPAAGRSHGDGLVREGELVAVAPAGTDVVDLHQPAHADDRAGIEAVPSGRAGNEDHAGIEVAGRAADPAAIGIVDVGAPFRS